MVGLHSTVVASPNQVHTELSGAVIVLNTENGIYYSLNPVGAFIWNLIREPKPVAEVCSAIMSEFDVDQDRCQQDLVALLNDLAAQGLIHVQDA